MEKQLIEWLKNTGLDQQRAELYLMALKRGEASAAQLADDLKIGRTAVYDNLRVLEERGFIKTVMYGRRKRFVALDPKQLQQKLRNQVAQLKELMPEFAQLAVGAPSQSFAQQFSGPFAAREVYEDILRTVKKEYLYFSPPELTLQTIEPRYIKEWIARRIKKKIASRSLRVKKSALKVDPFFRETAPHLRQVRYLPTYVDLKASIYLYEDNVGVIATRREGGAYIIRSRDLAFSLKQIFNFLWDISPRS